MVNINNFEANFKNLEIPTELTDLLNFQKSIAIGDHEKFTYQFCIGRDYSDKSGLNGYSNDEEFTNSIIEFAKAAGYGSTYAFWIRNNNKNLSDAPILAVTNKDGIHIIAKNIRELLEILTFDVEPTLRWDEMYFYKDENFYEPTDKTEEYKAWVLEKYGVKTTEYPAEIVNKAQEVYEVEFQNWFKKY